MKSLSELLIELGFNPGAPIQTQKAFLKHLRTAANATALKPVQNLKTDTNSTSQKSGACELENSIMSQLEFDFSKSKRAS